MKKCVVVKLYGNMEDATKIAEPFTKVIPVDDRQMQMVIAENKRLNALNGVRSYGDSVRFESVSKALALKYSTPTHGRLYEAVLGGWALLWLTVRGWYEYFSAWNREGA
jgi:hypothetical protein